MNHEINDIIFKNTTYDELKAEMTFDIDQK